MLVKLSHGMAKKATGGEDLSTEEIFMEWGRLLEKAVDLACL